jgi:hypothetical protein
MLPTASSSKSFGGDPSQRLRARPRWRMQAAESHRLNRAVRSFARLSGPLPAVDPLLSAVYTIPTKLPSTIIQDTLMRVAVPRLHSDVYKHPRPATRSLLPETSPHSPSTPASFTPATLFLTAHRTQRPRSPATPIQHRRRL